MLRALFKKLSRATRCAAKVELERRLNNRYVKYMRRRLQITQNIFLYHDNLSIVDRHSVK